MTGITNLDILLSEMEPVLQPGEFVFCSLPEAEGLPARIIPLGTFREKEGLTVILRRTDADMLDCTSSTPMRQITLTVHSSLDAVGLTAAIATELTRHGISANVVAAYYHDHVFVGAQDAERAVAALRTFSRRHAIT